VFIAILLVIDAHERLIGLVRSRRFSSLRPSGGVNPPPYAHRAAKAALFFCGITRSLLRFAGKIFQPKQPE